MQDRHDHIDATSAPREEQGQSLVIILMLGALLAFFGTVLTKMLVREAANIVNTKKRDMLFTAGDAALQRTSSLLLSDSTLWANPEGISGYASLTYSPGTLPPPYTDVSGVKYYILIRKGALSDSTNTGAATDWHVNQWVNKGSLLNDRTIFVRTIDALGKEDRFFTTVHRTDAPPFVWGGNAISAAGDITLGNNWTGHVYNSCLGPYNGSGSLPNSEGSITVGGSVPNTQIDKFAAGGQWDGYSYSPGTSLNNPALSVPATTIAIPGYSKTSAISANITLSNPADGTLVEYECYSLNLTSKTLTVNGPGKISLWITGPTGAKEFILGGSGDIVVNKNGSTECCIAKLFTCYVTADDPTTSDVSIEWHGCPTGNFMVVAPKANMDFRGGGSNVFFGALNVRNLVIAPNSNADFYYDACLKTKPPVDNYSKPPLITTSWQQIGLKTQPVP